MLSIYGLTITERIERDIEHAKAVSDREHRRLLGHMAIAAAELAVDYNLITHREWGKLVRKAFTLI